MPRYRDPKSPNYSFYNSTVIPACGLVFLTMSTAEAQKHAAGAAVTHPELGTIVSLSAHAAHVAADRSIR